MNNYRNFQLFFSFFICCLSMISAQQPAYLYGHVENSRGKLLKNARVEVLSKNVSRQEIKDGSFGLEFANDGMAVAVTVAYQAKGYKTQIQYYEFPPGVQMKLDIVLIRGRDNEKEYEDLQIRRYNNGLRQR